MDNVRELKAQKALNPEAIKLLEEALERAKNGEIVGVALVMQHTGGRIGTAYDAPDWFSLIGGLQHLILRISLDLSK